MEALIVSEPGVDGVFRYVETLCRYLDENGVGVHLAYSDRRGSDRLGELVSWVEVRGGRTLNLSVANRPELGDFRALFALLRLVRAVKPDVIHSHSSKAGVLARALRCLGCKAAQLYHPHAYIGMRPLRGRFDAVYNAVEACLARLATTVVVSTGEDVFARRRLRVPPKRVRMVPNGVDLERFAPVDGSRRRRIRETLGLPPFGAVLGYMARSCAQKDPVTLYRAFARVAAEHPVSLLHVGQGELDQELDAIVRERGLGGRVHRVPYMRDPADFYRGVDGFVLSSRYEGLSIAALEALAADLPLILSEAPGNEDLLGLPLSHCWSAAPGDVDGFALAIVQWASDLAQPRESNHRAVARERFNLHRNYGAVLDLYHDLAAGGPVTHVEPAMAPSRAVDEHVLTPTARTRSPEFATRRRPPAGTRRNE